MQIEKHHVIGISHYMDNLMKYSYESYLYNLKKSELIDEADLYERIYQYCFNYNSITLEPEPDNPYDPKAIKVLMDGDLVGYIKKGSCSHVLNLIDSNRIAKIESDVYGGKYKVLIDEDFDSYTLEKDETNFGITLSIYVIDEGEKLEESYSSNSISKLKLKTDTNSTPDNAVNLTSISNNNNLSNSNSKPTPQPLTPEQKRGCWSCLLSIILFFVILFILF